MMMMTNHYRDKMGGRDGIVWEGECAMNGKKNAEFQSKYLKVGTKV